MKKLKEAIFEITKNERDSDYRNQDKAMKIFINFSLAMSLNYYIQVAKIRRVDMTSRLLVSQSMIQEELSALVYEHSKLVKPYLLYLDLVRASEPFTDVLSGLYEETLLTRGRADALGEFYTPQDLARLSSMLLGVDLPSALEKGSVWLTEPCCGAGSLFLAPLHRIWSETPEKLKNVKLVINDLNGLAVRAAMLQIVSNLMIHSIELGEIHVFISNLITEYMKPGSHFISLVPAPLETNAFVRYERFASEVFNNIDSFKKEKARALSWEKTDATSSPSGENIEN